MKYIHTIAILIIALCSVSILSGQCIDDSHSPFAEQGWLSCNTSVSVVPERGDRHWILYDIGYSYELKDIQFWNHNVWGETEFGVKSLLIDYSIDGVNWSTVGPIDIEKAPGSWKYVANDAFQLDEKIARYLLFTVIDTWGDDACAGLGEIKINLGGLVAAEDIAENLISDLYPNPASDYIVLEIEDYEEIIELNITNSVGQIMKRLPLPSNSKIEIPVVDLHDGMYYVNVKSTAGRSAKSFVKL